MCVCIVYVLNSQSPNCCSFLYLTIDLSYCFSPYFLLSSVHLRAESFWWPRLQPCCPSVWRALAGLAVQAQRCSSSSSSSAAVPANTLHCCCLGSEHGCDTRLAANTRLAGDRLSILRARKRARKEAVSAFEYIPGEKPRFWHFERLSKSLTGSGDVPAAGDASASTDVGSASLPQPALTSMHAEPSSALGYSRVTPFPEPHLQGLGSLAAAKGQENWEPNSTPAHARRPPSVGRAADVHLVAAVAAHGLGTDWVALSNSAKFHS